MPAKKIVAVTFCLFVVWANSHGGFLYGLILLACVTVGARWSHEAPQKIAVLDRLVVSALLGTLVNPWGPALYTVFVQHAVDFHNAGSVLMEWAEPTVIAAPAFWICFVLGSFFSVRVLLQQRRADYLWIPAVVVFLVLGSRYLRTTSYAALIVLPFIGSKMREIKSGRMVLLFAIAVLAMFIWVEKPFLRLPRRQPLVDPTTIPAGGLAYLDNHHIDGRLFNTYAFGGFVEWNDGRARPVFMDGRYIFYPLVERYDATMTGKKMEINSENWARYFDDYGVDCALVKYEPLRLHRSWNKPIPHESVMGVMFPPQTWALVYWDDACLVFLKRLPKYANQIKTSEYIALTPYDALALINHLADGTIRVPDIVRELQRHQRETGTTQRANQMMDVLSH